MRYMWRRILERWGIRRVSDPATPKLTAAINQAVANKAWTSLPDGTTFCNSFCQQILHAFGCHELDGMVAREMGERVLQDIARAGEGLCNWQEVIPAKAVEMAKQDCLVLGWSACEGEAHGHVVVVAPEDMEDSGTFGTKVPMCASIAKYPFQNRVMKVSEAYRVANKPRYFLLTAIT